MSWQDYVDKQLLASRCVSKAAIAGHDGNLWAKSEGFEVSTNRDFFYFPSFLRFLITLMRDMEKFGEHPFRSAVGERERKKRCASVCVRVSVRRARSRIKGKPGNLNALKAIGYKRWRLLTSLTFLASPY